MNIIIKSPLRFVLRVIAFWAVFSCAAPLFAQGQERTFLAPLLNADSALFQRQYAFFYAHQDADSALSGIAQQKKRQQELISSIKAQAHNNPAFTERERKKIFTAIALAESTYGEKKFPVPSEEFVLNHVLEKAEVVIQEECPGLAAAVCAALFHRMDNETIRGISRKKILPKEIDEIIGLLDRFNPLTEFSYADMGLTGTRDIQNFMNMLIRISGADAPDGDPRPMLLLLADKLASIKFSSETERQKLAVEIDDVYAPLAHRLGAVNFKNRFFDEAFKVHNPVAYQQTKELVKSKLNVDYDDINSEVNLFRELLEESLSVYNPKMPVSLNIRVKGLYEIYEKKIEKEKEGKAYDLNDIVGIRLVCDCENNALWPLSDFVRGNVGTWVVKDYDEKAAGALYIDILPEETLVLNLPVEVQILTKAYHEAREKSNPHWSYKLAHRTGQKFDQTEDYIATGNFGVDFKRVYAAKEFQDWVFVLAANRDASGALQVKPKRLPRGAIAADVAALRNVDALTRRFSAAILRWKNGAWENYKSGILANYELENGDAVVITPLKEGISLAALNDLRKSSKLLRTRLLLSLIEFEKDTGGKKRKTVMSPGEKSLRNQFDLLGVTFAPGTAVVRFVEHFAAEQGLKNSEELFWAMTYWSTMVSVSDVMESARRQGERIVAETAAQNRIELNDFRLGQLADKFEVFSRENFFILVGIGQINIRDLQKNMELIKQGYRATKSMIEINSEKLHRFSVGLPLKIMKKSRGNKVNKLEQEIRAAASRFDLNMSEQRFREYESADNVLLDFFVSGPDQVRITAFQNELSKSLLLKRGTVLRHDYYDAVNKSQAWTITFVVRDAEEDAVGALNEFLLKQVRSWGGSVLTEFLSYPASKDAETQVRVVIKTILDDKAMRARINALKNSGLPGPSIKKESLENAFPISAISASI